MNGPDTAPLVVMNGSGQGDMQPLGTIIKTIISLNTARNGYSLPSATTTDFNRRYRTPETQSAWAIWSRSRQGMPPTANPFGLRECMLVKVKEEKQQQKVGWRPDELSRLSWTGRPTDLHWCTDAATLNIYIGDNITKQMERITFEPSGIANVPAETQGITNRSLVDEVINKPSSPTTLGHR